MPQQGGGSRFDHQRGGDRAASNIGDQARPGGWAKARSPWGGDVATIFYSWQSDAPNSVNRNFVRQALEAAAKNLSGSAGADVEDAVRLDQDTQGVAGSPAIVDTILAKIAACDVFVPDVTFMPASGERRTPNPNVMIEYGYALKTPGAEKIVAVMNTHFGDPTGLPFDMRHRRFPLTYDLAPDADSETRSRVRERLAADFSSAIVVVLDERSLPAAEQPLFERSPAFDGGASFVEANELFPMWVDGEGDTQRRFPVGPKMFLRLMPRDSVPPIERATIVEVLAASELWPLGYQRYGAWGMGTNRLGGGNVARHPADDSLIGAISQIILTREIWGIETHLLTHAASRQWVDRDYPVIPDTSVREILEDGLHRYLRVAREHLALTPPLVAVAGVVNLESHRLTLPPEARISTQIYESAIWRQIVIEDPDRPAAEILHPFYAALYDAVGVRLPSP